MLISDTRLDRPIVTQMIHNRDDDCFSELIKAVLFNCVVKKFAQLRHVEVMNGFDKGLDGVGCVGAHFLTVSVNTDNTHFWTLNTLNRSNQLFLYDL